MEQISKEELDAQIDEKFLDAVLEKEIEAYTHGDRNFEFDNFYHFPKLFDYLEKYILKNHKENFLLEDTKNNLYILVNYLRYEHVYESEEERLKRFYWCNDLIGLLNESTSSNALLYYCNQLTLRFAYVGQLSLGEFEEWLEFIYASIVDDIDLLESLDLCDDFYKQSYEKFLVNPYIIYNICLLLNDYPDIFYLNDIEKFHSILVGQYSLATMENITKLEVLDEQNKRYIYHIDSEIYQTLKEEINVSDIEKVMTQLSYGIELSLHNKDKDSNPSTSVASEEKQMTISKKK